MIDLPLLLAFVAAASVLAITPGADTAMVLRSATVDGRRSAVLAALGIQCGCLVWGLSVAFGLGALLRASELAYPRLPADLRHRRTFLALLDDKRLLRVRKFRCLSSP